MAICIQANLSLPASVVEWRPATKVGDEIALDRMWQAGIAVASTVQIMSEMVSNWAEGAGPQLMPVLGELYAALDRRL